MCTWYKIESKKKYLFSDPKGFARSAVLRAILLHVVSVDRLSSVDVPEYLSLLRQRLLRRTRAGRLIMGSWKSSKASHYREEGN